MLEAVTTERTLCTDPVSKEEGELPCTGAGEGFQAPYQQEQKKGHEEEEDRQGPRGHRKSWVCAWGTQDGGPPRKGWAGKEEGAVEGGVSLLTTVGVYILLAPGSNQRKGRSRTVW